MNNESNETNNVVQPDVAAPAAVPTENPVPEVAPVEAPVEAPVAAPVEAPVEAPAPEVPASPLVDTPAPVQEAAPEVAPVEAPAPEVPVSPLVETPAPAVTPEVTPMDNPGMGAQPTPTEEPKKKNNLLIIIIVAVVLIGAGIGLYFALSGKDDEPEEPTPTPTPKEDTPTAEQTAFYELAGKYVAAVEELWTNDKMVCQDAADTTKELKPTELSDKDSYGGDAYYYVFINTKDDTEFKLNVETTKDVAGWVRIGKADKNYYVALSDGTNYIIDPGTDPGKGIAFSTLTAKKVVTNGNGSNYQYMDTQIIGSNTDGEGWGIGDWKLLSDDDESNNDIYSIFGNKTSGYTPYCKSAE